MLKKSLLLGCLLFSLFLGWAVSAQEPVNEVWLSENGNFQLSYKSQLNPVVINQMHSWTLHVSNAQGEAVSDASITVNGGMPQHNHGLATSPSILPLGEGNYQIQGLRFHMMGYWELELNISQGSISDKVIITLDL